MPLPELHSSVSLGVSVSVKVYTPIWDHPTSFALWLLLYWKRGGRERETTPELIAIP